MDSRVYNVRDIDMLTGAGVIVLNAIKFKPVIVNSRPGWADPFFQNFNARISDALSNIIGFDNAGELRAATIAIHQIMTPAVKSIVDFKLQISIDYREDKIRMNDILTTLGFNTLYKKARRKNQCAMIELLYSFANNMTPELRTDITLRGTNPNLIDEIIGYAAALKEANVNQEVSKGKRKVKTAENVRELNDIYLCAIGICKIVRCILPAEKNLFSFRRIIKVMHGDSLEKKEVIPDGEGEEVVA